MPKKPRERKQDRYTDEGKPRDKSTGSEMQYEHDGKSDTLKISGL